MEMAMSGVPVIVGGYTHYRGKGFTLDPNSWEAYLNLLDETLPRLKAHQRLSREQVERAWQYAYRFFFDYPCPFPWHLLHAWKELETLPMQQVLSSEGQALYGETFSYLVGEPRRWSTAQNTTTAQDIAAAYDIGYHIGDDISDDDSETTRLETA
jgi:hypothetical protein